METGHSKANVDEIGGQLKQFNYEAWQHDFYSRTGQEFADLIGHISKEKIYRFSNESCLVSIDTLNYNGWELKLITRIDKHTGELQYELKIKGCPSKIFYGGENVSTLSVNDFRNVLLDFSETFCLPLEDIKIAAPTEASGTFQLDKPINDRLIIFQLRKPFEPLCNSDNEVMGYEVRKEINQHFHPKIYLPGKKFRKPLNSIRIERHYDKIATFSRDTGINTWGDLLDETKMFKCYQIVLNTWTDTIVFDPTLKPNVTKNSLLKQIIKQGYTPQFWQEKIKKQLSYKEQRKVIDEYNMLSLIYGEGLYENVLRSIQKEGEAWKNVTSICMVTNSIIHNENKKELISSNTKKYCISCNKDISHQSNRSKFCSSKYVGIKEAKKCRNKHSNSKHNSKRKKKLVTAPANNITPLPVQRRESKLRELLRKINEGYSRTA